MSHPHAPDSLQTRLAMAEEDLRSADDAHLATATNATLIAIIVKLRGALSDLIGLLRAIHEKQG